MSAAVLESGERPASRRCRINSYILPVAGCTSWRAAACSNAIFKARAPRSKRRVGVAADAPEMGERSGPTFYFRPLSLSRLVIEDCFLFYGRGIIDSCLLFCSPLYVGRPFERPRCSLRARRGHHAILSPSDVSCFAHVAVPASATPGAQ